jgi:O-glycosyl hydrolase
MKHFGHFAQPGAVRIGLSAGTGNGGSDAVFRNLNLVAFRNPSGELILMLANTGNQILPVTLQAGACAAKLEIPASSMNSLVLSKW